MQFIDLALAWLVEQAMHISLNEVERKEKTNYKITSSTNIINVPIWRQTFAHTVMSYYTDK